VLSAVDVGARVGRMAQHVGQGAGLICHSDRRSQYAAAAHGQQLAAMGAVAPMSRTGCCYDCEKVRAAWEARPVLTIDPLSWR
jgi:transposase InsO family protein